jgi:tetratricopeptide (TPR) repeat protein
MKLMLSKLLQIPSIILAVWQFQRALAAATKGDYVSAIDHIREADTALGKPAVEFLLLEGHCLFRLKQLEQSKLCFDKALELIEASKRLTKDDRSYLLNYMDEHFHISPDYVSYMPPAQIDMNKVRRRFLRQFPL